MKKGILIILAIFLVSVAAWSTESVFEVTNNTGFTIRSLYIADAETNADDWGSDLLDGKPLLDGQSIAVPLLEIEWRIVNVKARDDEGDTYNVYDVDTETEDIAIELLNIKPD